MVNMENLEKSIIAGMVAFLRADKEVTRKILSELVKDDATIQDTLRRLLEMQEQRENRPDTAEAPQVLPPTRKTGEPWINPERTNDWLKRPNNG
jgi:hypothetical protein